MKFSAFTFVGGLTEDIEWNGQFEYLLVGGGGNGYGPGGGAGGFITGSSFLYPSSSHTYSVGAGAPTSEVTSGSSTQVPTIYIRPLVAVGGGAGNINTIQDERNGGSGGGSPITTDFLNTNFGTGILGQGNDGGSSYRQSGGASGYGGGGGASQKGGNASTNPANPNSAFGGDGGDGKLWLDGKYYAGGGGGLGFSTSGEGGLGGGGDASPYVLPAQVPGSGVDGKGGGAGGARSSSALGKGGDGTFIIRYKANLPKVSGGNIYKKGGYWYHEYSGSGSFIVSAYNTGSQPLGTQLRMINTLDSSSICGLGTGSEEFFYINPDSSLETGSYIYQDPYMTIPASSSYYRESSNTSQYYNVNSNGLITDTINCAQIIPGWVYEKYIENISLRYQSFTNINNLDITSTGVTLEIWGKNPALTQNYDAFIGLWDGQSSPNRDWIEIREDGNNHVLGDIYNEESPSFENKTTPSSAVADRNNWYHHILTFDVNTNVAKYYRNGLLEGTVSSSLDPNILYDSLYVGQQEDGAGCNMFVGEYRVYSSSLDSDDVLNNFNVTKGRYGY